jgi:predicted membrane protein
MRDRKYKKRHNNNNNALAGLILLGIGGVWLLRQAAGDIIPSWLFSWPMILVAVGLFVGVRNNFQDMSWLVLMGVGAFFLVDRWFPELPIRHYIWPVIIIGAGLVMILSPRGRSLCGKRKWQDQEPGSAEPEPGTERNSADAAAWDAYNKVEVLDMVSVFAGFKKMVYSKNFKGGEVVCVFGGADIDLTQADIQGPIVIELVHIFGGSKLLIPPHWEVRSESAVIFGGIDDKRKSAQLPVDPNKVVILKGVIMFGGCEIKSY